MNYTIIPFQFQQFGRNKHTALLSVPLSYFLSQRWYIWWSLTPCHQDELYNSLCNFKHLLQPLPSRKVVSRAKINAVPFRIILEGINSLQGEANSSQGDKTCWCVPLDQRCYLDPSADLTSPWLPFALFSPCLVLTVPSYIHSTWRNGQLSWPRHHLGLSCCYNEFLLSKKPGR